MTLVDGYFDIPNLWYINTTAEFFILFAKTFVIFRQINKKIIIFDKLNNLNTHQCIYF